MTAGDYPTMRVEVMCHRCGGKGTRVQREEAAASDCVSRPGQHMCLFKVRTSACPQTLATDEDLSCTNLFISSPAAPEVGNTYRSRVS